MMHCIKYILFFRCLVLSHLVVYIHRNISMALENHSYFLSALQNQVHQLYIVQASPQLLQHLQLLQLFHRNHSKLKLKKLKNPQKNHNVYLESGSGQETTYTSSEEAMIIFQLVQESKYYFFNFSY